MSRSEEVLQKESKSARGGWRRKVEGCQVERTVQTGAKWPEPAVPLVGSSAKTVTSAR
jgi:predicted secreted protein